VGTISRHTGIELAEESFSPRPGSFQVQIYYPKQKDELSHRSSDYADLQRISHDAGLNDLDDYLLSCLDFETDVLKDEWKAFPISQLRVRKGDLTFGRP
jgi:hypothetical protein